MTNILNQKHISWKRHTQKAWFVHSRSPRIDRHLPFESLLIVLMQVGVGGGSLWFTWNHRESVDQSTATRLVGSSAASLGIFVSSPHRAFTTNHINRELCLMYTSAHFFYTWKPGTKKEPCLMLCFYVRGRKS